MNNYKAKKKKGDPQSEETKQTSEPDTDFGIIKQEYFMFS